MSHTRTQSLTLAMSSKDDQCVRTDRFNVAFRLGPYLLAQAPLDLTIHDLGVTAISGEKTGGAQFDGEELLLRSVPDWLCLASLCAEGDRFAYPFYGYDRCWVKTEGEFDAYLASFSKTSRKGLRRRVKQLTSASGDRLDIRHFADGETMDVFHTDARTISARTFQEKLMNDGLPDGDLFRRYIKNKAANGECYGSILYLDDEPISYLHCERQGPGWLAVYGGFDPNFAKLSPGTVHLVSILERSFEDPGCSFFDFGPGHSDYKHFFATDSVPSSDVLILKKTVKNKSIAGVHGALARTTDWSVDIAEKLRLKTLLRQKIRGR